MRPAGTPTGITPPSELAPSAQAANSCGGFYQPQTPFPVAKRPLNRRRPIGLATLFTSMHERLRKILLDRWARLIVRHPWLTLLICFTVAGVSVYFTATKLEFRPDRSDLIDRDLPWNDRYFQHKADFSRWNDLIVCISGPADDSRIDLLARFIAEELHDDERVTAADAGYLSSDASPRMFRAAPRKQFDEVLAKLAEARQLTERAPNANAALALMTAGLNKQSDDDRGVDASDVDGGGRLQQLRAILTPYVDAINGESVSFHALNIDEDQWIPFRSDSGMIRFVQVHFAKHSADAGGVDIVRDNVAFLRAQVEQLVAASVRPAVEWGVTGIPAMESDETTQSINDSTMASIIAFALITLLMIAVFRGVVIPIVAAVTLLIGVAWSFGWLMLAVGHLQLLSVVFTIILLGLGIDFSLHIIARLELLRDAYDDLGPAMGRVFQGIGPGLVTGALTTAAAFGVMMFTNFRGMAEMGIIASVGILLCLIAAFTVFPALLAIIGWKRFVRHRRGGETAHFAHGRLDFVDRRPAIMLGVVGFLVAAMILPALKVKYDPNVLKLQPPGIESVVWEKRIVGDGNRSAWAALSHATAERAPHLADSFRSIPEVSDVGGMGILYPADRDQRDAAIEAIKSQTLTPIVAEPTAEVQFIQLATIQRGLQSRLDETAGEAHQIAQSLIAELKGTLTTWQKMPAEQRDQTYQRIEVAYQTAIVPLRTYVAAAFQPGPLTAADLPPVLRDLWVGESGRWLLEIYPAADPRNRSVLHPDRLEKFVQAVRIADPLALGPPVQIYESSELIKSEYIKAALLAIGVILVLLMLDFQSIADVGCSMLPVGVGFLGVFAMLGLFGVSLNFANIIVLPLIFGIGVDAGVHMVHRWRVEPLGRPAGLSGATGRSITLTMMTTVLGFGCMLLAQHRGIQSLGFVMVVGMSITLLACYLVLPPVLRIRTTRAMVDAVADDEQHIELTRRKAG